MNEQKTHSTATESKSNGNGNGNSHRPTERRGFARQLPATLVVLVVLSLVGFLLTRQARSEQEKPAAPQDPNTVSVTPEGKQTTEIQTGVAKLERLDASIKTTGLVSFPSDRTVKIAPRLTGRVRDVFVKLGDHVAAGQTVAILESVDAATAQTTFEQNRAALQQARLDLERQERLYRLGTPDVTSAQAAYDEAVTARKAAKVVLDLAKNQEKIGGFTQKPLEDATNALITAQSTLSQARSDLTLAEKDYSRKKQLLALGIVAQSDMEQSQDSYDKAKANVQAGEDGVKLAQEAVSREKKAFQSNLYADQTIKQNEAAYVQALLQESAAQKALQLAKTQVLRDLQAARTAYATANYTYENSQQALTLLGHPRADGTVPVTSPIAGVVTERDVSPGQVVDQSQETPWQMFVISNADSVWVDADVHEGDIAEVSKGARVSIAVAGAPGRTFDGAVSNIAPTLDKTSHTVKVRSVIPNRSGLLKDGMYADVNIHVAGGRSAVVIPLVAVSHEQDGDYIYAPGAGVYHRRLVTLGPIRGDKVVVTKGVKAGEQVVTHGALFLGAQISDD